MFPVIFTIFSTPIILTISLNPIPGDEGGGGGGGGGGS